jgi:hypothetical protein
MNIEHASLCLKPQLLSIGNTNYYGTCNAGFSQYTYTSINLRQVLGSMYDKYNKFNLILKNVMTESVQTWGTTSQDQSVMINISGFNFINNYEVSTKTSTQTSTLTALLLNGGLSLSYTNNCVATFTIDGQENIDIMITYNRITDGLLGNGVYGKILFIFDIVPIS